MKEKLLTKFGKVLSKQSPTILAVMGAVGAVTAVGLAIYATKKSVDEIKGAEEELSEPLTKKEAVKLVWKNYIPAATILGISVVCTLGSNTVNLKRNAMLAASYAAVNEKFEDYKTAAKEVLGEKGEKEVHDKCMENRMKEKLDENEDGLVDIIATGTGSTLCYDDFSGRFFRSDLQMIRKAVNDVNYSIMSHYEVELNEFYEMIGLQASGCGKDLGFTTESMMDPIYSSMLTESGQPCICIDVSPGIRRI